MNSDVQLLQYYASSRIIELERLPLVNVPETVWPAEVGMVYSQVETAGDHPIHHLRRLKHHINRMWLEKMPVPVNVSCVDGRSIFGLRHGIIINQKSAE